LNGQLSKGNHAFPLYNEGNLDLSWQFEVKDAHFTIFNTRIFFSASGGLAVVGRELRFWFWNQAQ